MSYTSFTEAWLARFSGHTREAYRRDVASWMSWCSGRRLDPSGASPGDVNAYAKDLETRPMAASTVARKLSGLSSWYDHLVERDVVAANPVSGADRPYVDREHSATVGLSPDEVGALLAAAERQDGPAAVRHRAVLTLLTDLGLRVGELVGLDHDDLGWERGRRTLRFAGRGGRPRCRALTAGAGAALDRYLAVRGDGRGPLFETATGARLDRHAVFRLVRRLAAEAGIPAAERLSPNSLRHAFATTARAGGMPLADVQDAMGHADPRTTRRYEPHPGPPSLRVTRPPML
ncbi:tyrosine-type recombinase/integrase [Actinoplanes sp. NPDC051851]|uniref:tyrosine-type recombinase/integrase n=1 Tax=Actinoplanes sp. NPDC051851 TaxID=3154753 RepID=UPI0034187371